MGHVVLLGDSIFDNAIYVPGGPSVIEHLRRGLPPGWRATLLAIDGSLVEKVELQLARLPADATHLIVSAGGNNALDHSSVILYESATSFAQVLRSLAEIQQDFQKVYRRMLQTVLAQRKPTAVCTVYDCIPGIDEAEKAGLCLFNDVISREAFRVGVPLIDLRVICNEASDYATSSPIEPSVAGGGKIARAIVRLVTSAESRPEGNWVIT